MLVTIAAAAASVALAPAPAERAAPGPAISPKPAMVILRETRPVAVCKGAGRMYVSYEPTLLYRPDPNDRAKKLIEMPMAQGCLLGGAR